MLYCICALTQTCVHIRVRLSQFYFSLCSGPTSSWVISMQVESFRENKNHWNENCTEIERKTLVHCKALLQHRHGNGEESMKCWSQNLKVTQSIHVLIIPLPYERNITSLVSMMKIHIRSFQPVYFSSEHKELAMRVKTRK